MGRDLASGHDGGTQEAGLPVQRARRNLPSQLSSFVGRESELAELGCLSGTTRLLTLTGTGGVGKTRLAFQLAERLEPSFSDGVWQVALASLSQPRLLPEAVAEALGVHEQPGRAMLERLADWLSERRLLLVLDNCEHLVVACAGLIEHLLNACPSLRILATSREPLGVAGEMLYRVPPLALPGSGQSGYSPDGPLDRYEAVQLFTERARVARPNFVLSPDMLTQVAEICRRVDGLPLAIELAAARLTVLTVEQIHARLDDRFRLLRQLNSTAEPRHRTLGALVDWSYELLAEPEQRLLRRLSVFAGGWSLEAAEAVCTGAAAGSGVNDEPTCPPRPSTEAEPEVLDLLDSLVKKSLVLADEQDGVMRYSVLETIRQYGRARLAEAGEEAAIRARHQHWYAELAEWAAPRVLGPDLVRTCNQLSLELDNLRTALAWAREAPAEWRRSAIDRSLRLAGGLIHFWDIRGHFNEGRAWLADLLERAAEIEADPNSGALHLALGRALCAAGYLAFVHGDLAEAERLWLEAHRRSSAAAHDYHVALTSSHLGMAALVRNDVESGTLWLEEALALGRRIGAWFVVAACEYYAGLAAALRRDWPGAVAHFEASLAITRREGILWGTPYVLVSSGHLATIHGEHGRALALQREALALRFEIQDLRGVAFSLGDLAVALAASGDSRSAVLLLGAADTLLEYLGVADILMPEWRVRREQTMETARKALGPHGFEAAYARGRALRPNEAVKLGLDSGRIEPSETARLGDLTRRETEILRLVAAGLTNAEIAAQLSLSLSTVKHHVAHILDKIGVENRTAAAAFAFRHRLG